MSEATGSPARRMRRTAGLSSEAATFDLAGKAPRKRIMLVVQGRLFRNGIEHVLQGPDRTIIGDCEVLDQIEAALGALQEADPIPDLFVVGIATPTDAADEFARIRALQARMPNSRWIVLSRSANLDFLREAIESGIAGVLLEDAPGEALQLVVELVLLGHSFVPIELAKILAAASHNAVHGDARMPTLLPHSAPHAAIEVGEAPILAEPVLAEPDLTRRWQVSLSDRENEILHCLVSGHPNKLIARELRIAEATVKVHVKALLRKMQVSNRTQAAISALQYLRAEGSARRPRMAEVGPGHSELDRNLLVASKAAAMLRAPDKVAFRPPPAE